MLVLEPSGAWEKNVLLQSQISCLPAATCALLVCLGATALRLSSAALYHCILSAQIRRLVLFLYLSVAENTLKIFLFP